MTTCQRDPIGCPFPRRHRKYRTQLWICPNCGQGWRRGDGTHFPRKWIQWPVLPMYLTSNDVESRIWKQIRKHEADYKHKLKPEDPFVGGITPNSPQWSVS